MVRETATVLDVAHSDDDFAKDTAWSMLSNTGGIDLGVEEQVFEPKSQTTGLVGMKRRRTQRTLRPRKRLQWSN